MFFKYTHRLNDKLIQNEILKKNNLLINYCWHFGFDWAFVGTVCLIAIRCSVSGEHDAIDVGELVRHLVSLFINLSCSFLTCISSLIHLSTLLPSLSMTLAWSQSMTWLREIAWSVTADLFCSPAPHIRHPVCPETERQTAIRQTVPTKAPVKAETSTIIN